MAQDPKALIDDNILKTIARLNRALDKSFLGVVANLAPALDEQAAFATRFDALVQDRQNRVLRQIAAAPSLRLVGSGGHRRAPAEPSVAKPRWPRNTAIWLYEFELRQAGKWGR